MSITKTILARRSTKYLQQIWKVPHRNMFGWFMYSPKKGIDRDWLARLQQPIDPTAEGLYKYLKKKEWEALKHDQRYIAERHTNLGPDLATAHFVVKRGGAVKFVNSRKWIEQDEKGNFLLPDRFAPNFILEAVDASNTNIMYESFDNFVNLRRLQYLNFTNCKYIDDWCIDRLQMFKDTLLSLDVSGCPNVTERGLGALHKVPKLRHLRAQNMPNIPHQPLLKLLLEEMMPLCEIDGLDQELHVDDTKSAQLDQM